MSKRERAPRVLIRELTDEGLIEHYIGLKELAYNAACIRSPQLGRLLRELDITIAIARKRGIDFSAAWLPRDCS